MSNAGGYEEYAFIADLYDFVVPYRDRPDIRFFVDAAIDAGSPILEVGCGTGRVLIPTARAGVEVVGLDFSSHMLAVCSERLRQQSTDVQSLVQLVQADMRSFDLARRFNLITLPFRPFQHLLTVSDQRACLETLRAHLADDGRLILDLFNPSLEALANRQEGEEFGEEPEFTTPDGRRVVRRHKILMHDRFTQTNKIELLYYITHPGGREERLVHSLTTRYLFRFEAEHLLARCGFDVEHLYAGFDKSPYGSKYPGELIFVARKASGGLRRS
jgi:SAM-dependent methyltransferase